MKVHKRSKIEYQPFYQYIEQNNPANKNVSNLLVYEETEDKPENTSFLLQSATNFREEIANCFDPDSISLKLQQAVKKIIPGKESAILIINDSDNSLMPVTTRESVLISERLNHYSREGILNIIFESQKVMTLPELNSYDADGPKFNYLIFPIFEAEKKRGVYSILLAASHKKITNLEKETIQLMLAFALSRIDKYLFKTKLNYTYEELQTYQAKLSNDFRLAAIGELTDGILEDIMTPLQVITSYVDLMEQDTQETPEIKKIKNQISKINAAINRIVKFSNLNQKDVKIQPCNLNDVINEYYGLVRSTIANLSLELVLDFEKNIPSILTHPNYVYQLITTLIGIIKTKIKGNGGILLQTRFKSDYILLRLISTANLKSYNSQTDAKKTGRAIDLNTRIVENLMNKHEGKLVIESFEENSSTITLYFPLIRKIRI